MEKEILNGVNSLFIFDEKINKNIDEINKLIYSNDKDIVLKREYYSKIGDKYLLFYSLYKMKEIKKVLKGHKLLNIITAFIHRFNSNSFLLFLLFSKIKNIKQFKEEVSINGADNHLISKNSSKHKVGTIVEVMFGYLLENKTNEEIIIFFNKVFGEYINFIINNVYKKEESLKELKKLINYFGILDENKVQFFINAIMFLEFGKGNGEIKLKIKENNNKYLVFKNKVIKSIFHKNLRDFYDDEEEELNYFLDIMKRKLNLGRDELLTKFNNYILENY